MKALRLLLFATILGVAALLPSASLATSTGELTTKLQAMNGDFKVAQGSTLYAGFDFAMPAGSHPGADVFFDSTTVTFNATCATGTPGSTTITVPFDGLEYGVSAHSTSWYPSGDQKSGSTYQGSVTVPSFCDGGALVRLQQGGVFHTFVYSTDNTDKVNVRWHYAAGGVGGWSGTYTVIPSGAG